MLDSQTTTELRRRAHLELIKSKILEAKELATELADELQAEYDAIPYVVTQNGEGEWTPKHETLYSDLRTATHMEEMVEKMLDVELDHLSFSFNRPLLLDSDSIMAYMRISEEVRAEHVA